ncbi:coiled-coil domain-containing protein 174-like [Scleropages formosus]|uniref:Coiled-coil domain containing 174 n=1 Tax=Scleropages formosus TaxID=113540 RepID=A0A0P7US78_SCLFO|nr:coiled-coil domain-containing protein 174 [Scleropages formosus]KPP72247.1 coiled-coil domain-containing protein 174-like [Scleropages formosus]
MDKKKKQYDVTAASLVELKAELFRKQEQFHRDKVRVDAGRKEPKCKSQKPGSVWRKQNEGVSARAQKDEQQVTEEEKSLEKSRRKLEEKAQLYEQMTRGDFPDEETESLYLVDFTQKIIDQKKGMQSQREARQNTDSDGEEDGEGTEPIPPPANPDEEWVDYVDALGRSRRCMKKDLPSFQKMDHELRGQKCEPGGKTLLSEDMRRELQRQQWEQEEEEAMKRPVGPVHYEDVREQEARELGVGYYAFARDEALRKKQRETLDMLRDQTTDQRNKRDKLKEKRKALLEARLAKVRQRKMKKMKLDGSEEELATEENEGVAEKESTASLPTAEGLTETPVEPLAPGSKKVEVEIQERRDTKPGVPHVREWDRGKEFSFGRWKSQQRDEREMEFAPPSSYFNSRRKADRGADRGEQTLAFRWSGLGTQSGGSETAPSRPAGSVQSHSAPQTQSQNAPNAPQSHTQSLDDLLSFYRLSS